MFNYINGLPADHPFNRWDIDAPFHELNGENSLEGLRAFETDFNTWLSSLEQNTEIDTETFLNDFDQLNKRLEEFSEIFGVIPVIAANASLSETHEAVETIIQRIKTQRDYSKAIHTHLLKAKNSEFYRDSTAIGQRFVDHWIEFLVRNGCLLNDADKTALDEVKNKIRTLEIEFGANVRDAKDTWYFQISNPAALAGLPSSLLTKLKDNARKVGVTGWIVLADPNEGLNDLNGISMNYLLMKDIYEALEKLATDACPKTKQFSNDRIVSEILMHRQRMADILGFETYAHYRADTTALKDPNNIQAFLNKVGERATSFSKGNEALVIKAAPKLTPDIQANLSSIWRAHEAHFRYKTRQAYQIRGDKPVEISEDAAYETLFEFIHEFFGVKFTETHPDNRWGDDVRVFEAHDESGKKLGTVHCDIKHRPGKIDGAQLGQARAHISRDGNDVTPIGMLIAKYRVDDKTGKTLLNTYELSVLFHEFGHFINLIASANNSNIPFASQRSLNSHCASIDGVEMPSQLLELKAFEPEILRRAIERTSGKPVDEDVLRETMLFDASHRAMTLQGMAKDTLADIQLHAQNNTNAKPGESNKIKLALSQQFPRVSDSKTGAGINTMLHAFYLKYECYYYTYTWTLAMAAQILEQSKNKPYNSREVGRGLYETLYAGGGSADFYDMFKDYTGGELDFDAFSKFFGIDRPFEEWFEEQTGKFSKPKIQPSAQTQAATARPVIHSRQLPVGRPVFYPQPVTQPVVMYPTVRRV